MEKFTFLEMHFDGAQFGPREMRVGDADADADSPVESGEGSDGEETDSSGGPETLLGLVALSVVLAVVATLIARRLAGGGDGTDDEDEDGGPVEVRVD